MRRKIAMISVRPVVLADPASLSRLQITSYLAQVAQQIARQGHRVDIFTGQADQDLLQVDPWVEDVRLIRVPAPYAEDLPADTLPASMQAFTNYVIDFCNEQSRPYDLIHANFWLAGLVAMEIKAALGIPYVLTFHARDRDWRRYQRSEDLPSGLFSGIQDRILREADGIAAESPEDRRDLISLYSAHPSYIIQLPYRPEAEALVAIEDVRAGVQPRTAGGDPRLVVWQRAASRLAEFYEDVLAVRRVSVARAEPAWPAPCEPGRRNRRERLDYAYESGVPLPDETRERAAAQIVEAADLMVECLEQGGKIMVYGDVRRPATQQPDTSLPILWLTAGSSAAEQTEEHLLRQLQALGRPGDLFVGMPAGETAETLAGALRSARESGIRCLSLIGEKDETLFFLSDVAIVIPDSYTPWLYMLQMLIIDLLCQLVQHGFNTTRQIPSESLYSAVERVFLNRSVE